MQVVEKKLMMNKLLAESLKYLSGRAYGERDLRLKLEKDFLEILQKTELLKTQ